MVRSMARKQVLVQLDDAQLAALDALAGGIDRSRSGLIRQAIGLYLEAVNEGLADVRYADAYARVPEDLAEHEGLRALGLGAWHQR
jgi:Ribbon-helix-helix protein, copG family